MYSKLLNRLCPFDNKYDKYVIHSVIFESKQCQSISTLEEFTEYRAWALRSEKDPDNRERIDSSSFLSPYFSANEFEKMKSQLEHFNIPYKVLNS